jgi:hypothetical protein
MTYILVLQWPADSIADYDRLIAVEQRLGDALGGGAAIDGHDMGSGEMNIFIETDRPAETFDDVQACLGQDPLSTNLRAAYRASSGDEYTVLWPPGQHAFSVT